MEVKWVFSFGKGRAEGDASMREILGGKGANLHEMTRLGIPVPPGFTISTQACVYYLDKGEWPPGLENEVKEHMAHLEEAMGRGFGNRNHPLLVSVRSGARVSMPGMMDTILNLGLNDETVEGLAKVTDNPRFAYDSYRRLLQMFGEVVRGIPHQRFEHQLEEVKKARGITQDVELTAQDLLEVIRLYKEVFKGEGTSFPQEPWEQLKDAIEAVFKSWNNERARTYRRIHDIPDDWGTAVNVQTMVFGNLGDDSGTGVCFTRNPATGEKGLFGEFLPNAQGEDVVAGIRTPLPIFKLQDWMPSVYQGLEELGQLLERHYRDMQDMEFTIERGKLYILQTRAGKRTVRAAIRIAVEMVEDGIIDRATALLRVDPEQLCQILHPDIDPSAVYCVMARGLPASPGAASGKVVFSAKEAEEWADRGEPVILVRQETSPEDIGGMNVAQGILTARGGITSHAAVVARGMGKCCVVGCDALIINEEEGYILAEGVRINRGDIITLNGSTGEVIQGKVPLVEADPGPYFSRLMEWADSVRTLKVRANVDTPENASLARKLGAEGIGLCRTEHMFFEKERINVVREMILAETVQERKKALTRLLPMQKEDFKGIFKAMEGLPVTIRLLDPPLHEFLPRTHQEMEAFSQETGVPLERVMEKVARLHEFNPMLGLRGCRLGILFPEIYRMQVRAIFEAACELVKEGVDVRPEVMVPLVAHVREMRILRDLIEKEALTVMKEQGIKVGYLIGTMIELPRAALTADEIAQEAEFFSFGTNDLTQTTLGISRDDAAKFLPEYVELGIYPKDPFSCLEEEGMGQLIEMGVVKGRNTRHNIKLGICGEHGGDPASIRFCHRMGLDYVSCSPYRIPTARLAAAQARVREDLMKWEEEAA
ncbi:MAG TPA: pyruvate, phosphate dikinase [Thermosulfidibacter takaii]|uniref:Pyruvate, phosphate dikinase n=1 Tax=Thermosulfidibacter takaii TaxID=412593 RepID=A0A7C0U6I5_9BACT|nr:pyruvate, phosphate dikinase [Thermosulfidibacter takaii]